MKRVLLIILLHLSLFFIVFAYHAQAEEDEMWTIEEDYCLKMFEGQYGLDSGSLEQIKMVWQLEFSKTPGLRKLRNLDGYIRKSLVRHSKLSHKKNLNYKYEIGLD